MSYNGNSTSPQSLGASNPRPAVPDAPAAPAAPAARSPPAHSPRVSGQYSFPDAYAGQSTTLRDTMVRLRESNFYPHTRPQTAMVREWTAEEYAVLAIDRQAHKQRSNGPSHITEDMLEQ